jgi:SAM-dependent methyltransferase
VIADSPDAMRGTLACAWCERPLHVAIATPRTVWRCPACGSRTDAWLAAKEHARLPSPAQQPTDAAHRCTVAETLRRRARRRVAHRVARMAPPGPVLDVGSGDGTLLDALRADGRAATAIGPTSTRAEVHDVDITELGGRYAAIVFWQSLGRAPAPRAALEHAAALLKPGGLLTIAQPTAGLPALTERLRGTADGGTARGQRVRIPQRTLVERLHALGLEVLRADRTGADVAGWPATLLGGVVSVEARR